MGTAFGISPSNSELLYLAAYVDYATNDNDSAMKTVQRVLATDPEAYGARKPLRLSARGEERICAGGGAVDRPPCARALRTRISDEQNTAS